ncbi:MAG: YIP1 family protein [Clostridia bacterium]|nr:YIP1 family protein [Clostridia bacterium]MBQ9802372.1 YIP1 family protein [Clostridia bacterium]
MKKLISFTCVLFALLMVFAIPAGAAQAYTTYTYSIDGKPLYSPDAYKAEKTITSTSMGLDTALANPNDMVTDAAGNVYIADTDNDRILCLDRYYHLRFEIKNFINGQGIADYFTKPEGVFVTEDRYEGDELKYPGRIFVCDTQASRIVTFNHDGSFNSVIEAPESELFSEDAVYWPVAMAVDAYERLYVVSTETSEGIIVMTDKGEFTTFIGAQQSVLSVWEQLWRKFQTAEQRKQATNVVSYPYNNISINEDGFIYASIYAQDLLAQMESAITTKSKLGTYAPVKLLNPAGDEIMRRNGFWPPAGEIDYKASAKGSDTAGAISRVEDVACGPEGTWSIFDFERSKIFTYDYDGNLLFAFGDTGNQLGNITEKSIRAICYQDDVFLVLDVTGNITVFKRTEYGDVLIQALYHQNERLYDRAIDDWKEILMRNSNYDAAYIGIGQALSRSGKYEEALEYYQAAYDTENYSVAYKELRKEWMSRFFLMIPVVIVVVCLLLGKFLKHAAKINKQVSVSGKKRTFKDELYYVFHVMFHPIDGFWDLKHEKRGSVRAALVYMGVTVLALFYRAVGSGYVMDPQNTGNANIFMQILVVFVPVLLFVVANWCLTTLFEGEGSFKDIFMSVGYSVLPIAITTIPVTLISNFVVSEELDILNLIIVLGFIWAGMLIFFGTMVTHDYTMGKNLITVLGTIVGMAFIMFLGVLFTSLVMDMVSFFTSIVSEINYRL